MEYKIINNNPNSENHSTRLKRLFEESNQVIIVSPFLMTDFSNFLNELNLKKLEKIKLITKLPEKSIEQIKNIKSIISLIEYPAIKDKAINCEISINNKLHGKIYIFKNENDYISAIISSANFTDRGLSHNHEWGIEIYDKTQIDELVNSILCTLDFNNIPFPDLRKMQKEADAFLAKEPQTQAENKKIDLNLIGYTSLPQLNVALDKNIGYFLKPIGVSGDPVSEDRIFNQVKDRLHFSTRRPNNVKTNDILITYGVGRSKILSLYKALSEPLYVTVDEIDEDEWLERWPWYVEAENLTPKFGKNWVKNNLHINSLKDEYLKQNPNATITAVGGKTLGALNFGADKIKLDFDFAKFIISKICNKNNDIF